MQDTEYFLVKNWQFENPNYNDLYYPYFNIPGKITRARFVNGNGMEQIQLTRDNRLPGGLYNWVGQPAVTSLPGMPGQGNPNPYSDFGYHMVVKLENNIIYDPSYGLSYPSYRAYEEGALQALFKEEVIIIDERDINFDLDGNGVIQPNTEYIYLKIRNNPNQNADIKEF